MVGLFFWRGFIVDFVDMQYQHNMCPDNSLYYHPCYELCS